MSEFELIQRYFARNQPTSSAVTLGIGDDAAILQLPVGELLVVSVDTMVAGTHFLADTPAELIAQRALGAAVSDLAAMAARPLWYTLALTLPDVSESWLEAFAVALAQRSAELGIILVGGDTTRGPLSLTLTVQGSVQPGLALQRKGAQVGDIIAVTGTLGDSRAGLESLLHPQKATMADLDWLRQRFYRPEPRLQLAQQLAPLAHCAIDISDGLMADLGHLLQASQLGAELELTALPLSPALKNFSQDQQRLRDWALSGGEDFELCLTIPAANWAQAQALAASLAIPLTDVGRIIAAPTLCLLDEGQPVPLSQVHQGGYDHFRRIHD